MAPMPMLAALRRDLSGNWVDCSIREAVHKRRSTYRCKHCNRHVVPHGMWKGARFKHVTASPTCPYSRRPRREQQQQGQKQPNGPTKR